MTHARSDPSLDETLLAAWAETIAALAPEQTIRPASRSLDTSSRHALEALRAAPAAVVLDETLGEGGMGVVRLATQTALGRQVAVKTLKDGVTAEQALLKVVREAWVTGSLEHPNVVPVYDVGLDDRGRPQIVLKRIEGTEWSEVFANPERARELFDAEDLFALNLEVFQTVCRAVHFAHSKGVLHRDIKPENVMIGSFGEVYVLDWGIAVSVRDDGTGRFALASEATEMAGTPLYMAPEMLGGPDPELSERTDVYLLGATLYEIVCGRPPHRGSSAVEIVSSIAMSEPILDEEVPAELAAIIRRALARDPAERFADVDELRLAVRSFVLHRGSATIAAEAERRLERLAAEVDNPDRRDGRGRIELYGLLHECQFGFQQALDAWPDNAQAAADLDRANVTMIEYELTRGDPQSASALTGHLATVDEELEARIESARIVADARRAETERLASVGRSRDPKVGSRLRVVLAATFGALWVAVPLVGQLVGQAEDGSYVDAIAWPAAILLVCLCATPFVFRTMWRTSINRALGGAVIAALIGEIMLLTGAMNLGLDPAHAQVLHIYVWAAVACMVAAAVDLWWIPTAVALFAAATYASFFPSHRFLAMSACLAVTLVNALLWTRSRRATGEV